MFTNLSVKYLFIKNVYSMEIHNVQIMLTTQPILFLPRDAIHPRY